MEQTTSTATTTVGPPDILTPLVEYLKNGDFFTGWTQDAGVLLSQTWFGYSVFAYLASFVFLYIFIYASLRNSRLREEEEASVAAARESYQAFYGQTTKHTKWDSVMGHIDSDNPNDWKLAIIEADIMLDDYLQQAGYPGLSLGERLKSISPQSLGTLDDAWEAHKIRNQIAHGGSDFVLTQKLARDTVARYRAVFTELKVI